MADGNNLLGALKTIFECVNASDTSKEAVEAIEAENDKLRQEKFDLMTKLNQLLKVKTTQLVLLKSLTSQLETQKQVQAEFKELTAMRIKERSKRNSDHIQVCRQRLKQTESSLILPYDKVLEKIREMEMKTESNLQKSRNLSEEYKKHTQQLGHLMKFSETLKHIEQEQKKQLQKASKN